MLKLDPDQVETPIWVSIAALGDWTELPQFPSRLKLSLEEVEDSWREDLIQQGWDTDVFEKALLKKLRQNNQVIIGELSFKPYVDEQAEIRFPSRERENEFLPAHQHMACKIVHQ